LGELILSKSKKTEEKLQESEEKYRNLVDNALVGVYRTNPKGEVLYVNDAFVKMLEFESAEEFISSGALARYKNPKDRELLIEELKKTGKVDNFETALLTKTGKTKNILASAILEGEFLSGMVLDITERKLAEEALKESDESHRVLLESANDLIQVVGPDGRLLRANLAWREILGYSEKEIAGLSLFDVIHPSSQRHCKKLFERVISGESTDKIEAVFVAKDGKEVIVEVSANCRFIDEAPVSIMCILRDITERRAAEEMLRDSEEKYRGIFENSDDVIIYVDKSGKVLDVNKKVEDMVGCKPDELVGKNIFKSGLIGLKDVPKMTKMFFESIRKGGVFETDGTSINITELEIECKDGSSVFVEANTSTIRKNGKLEGFLSMIRDITERREAEKAIKESEEKYRDLYDNAPDMYHSLDKNGIIIDCNETEARMLGYKKEEIIGRPLTDFFTEESGGLFKEDFSRLNKEKTRLTLERKYVREDGTVFPASLNVFAEFDKDGELIGTKTISRDITTRKKAEVALRDAYRKLRSLDELKSDIIANVSHELRTPITIIRGALEIAKEEKDPKERETLLRMAQNALMRQNAIIGDLIDATKLKEEKKLKLEPMDLHNVITIVSSEFEAVALKNKLKMKIDVEKDIPLVKADFEGLLHILRNLLSNATKFNKEGGKVTVSAKEKEGMVEVCVSDTGIGIAEDQLDKIFERLYQVDSSSGRPYGGTGMGLAIAKEMVEAHSGKIWVESRPGKGGRFYFTLLTGLSEI
jgi:PAS domain S-box-containing protein